MSSVQNWVRGSIAAFQTFMLKRHYARPL
jgi:hypothetical protein